MGEHVVTDEQVDQMLRQTWRMLQNERSEETKSRAVGVFGALVHLGLLSELEMLGWTVRFETCPEGGVHVGGRTWCSYCGDVQSVRDETIDDRERDDKD